jgi:crotonobetainyl-CoA:carnitine CoA-transferase CaiB-like acyl-CoA transferase
MGWAGPLVGQMFAEMGADVIKVEDTEHFDWWRGSLSIAAPEMQPIERSSPFNTANRGITLDLANPRGIEILKRLIEVSDMLIENYSPRVMEKLGLPYSVVSALNPRMIMISMPSFGSDGPECEARGYGNTVEAMAGVTGQTGYHDSPQRYTLSNALGDPVAGLHGTFALLAALHERSRTGHGQWIELAQVETLIPFMTRAMLEYQFSGKVPPPRGNRHPTHAPHGIYRVAGDEAWIAIACESDQQWQNLATALSLDHLRNDPRFADAVSRKANEDALDAELSRAIADASADEIVGRLRDVGVLAAPVNSAPAVLGDPQLQARDYFVAIDRAVVGTHLYPGAVANLPETPLRDDVAAYCRAIGKGDSDLAIVDEFNAFRSAKTITAGCPGSKHSYVFVSRAGGGPDGRDSIHDVQFMVELGTRSYQVLELVCDLFQFWEIFLRHHTNLDLQEFSTEIRAGLLGRVRATIFHEAVTRRLVPVSEPAPASASVEVLQAEIGQRLANVAFYIEEREILRPGLAKYTGRTFLDNSNVNAKRDQTLSWLGGGCTPVIGKSL